MALYMFMYIQIFSKYLHYIISPQKYGYRLEYKYKGQTILPWFYWLHIIVDMYVKFF